MSIESMVQEFAAVAASPKAQLKKYKDAGYKCIGVLPYYAPEELVAAASDIFWVNEPILPLLRHLAGLLFPRGLLSNTGPHHWTYIQTAFPKILALIPSHRIVSYAVHAMKPYPEIYKIALDEARREIPDLSPEQVLLIDDLEENVKGAEEFGFQAVHYQDDASLERELRARGVPLPEESAS